MSVPRSYLYVPGDRPDRLEKAFARGADALIVDLEDAVVPEAKDRALDTVLAWADGLSAGQAPVWVRVNTGERQEEEVRRLLEKTAVVGFCLPKTETAGDVERVHRLLGDVDRDIRIAPLLESATSIVNVHEIAAAPRVQLLHIGEIDLAADLGVTPRPAGDELRYVRSLVVIASRHAGLLPPPAPVSAQIDDGAAYRASTVRLKDLGFVGRACIHPDQVAIANEVFTATPDEIAWAKGVLSAAEGNDGAFRAADGSMVDEAVLRRARGLLAPLG